MRREDIIPMSTRELEKLEVIRQVYDGQIKQREASERLYLSKRQIIRILKNTVKKDPVALFMVSEANLPIRLKNLKKND